MSNPIPVNSTVHVKIGENTEVGAVMQDRGDLVRCLVGFQIFDVLRSNVLVETVEKCPHCHGRGCLIKKATAL